MYCMCAIKEIPFKPKGIIETLWDFGDHLDLGFTNFGLWVKSRIPPVFINQALLEHSNVFSMAACMLQLWS